MSLGAIDVAVIVVYVVLTLLIGLIFAKRASAGVDEYFVAGRSLRWYMVGTSMVATTLAADTPLAVTELVRTGGVAGAWYGWSAAFGTVTAAIFFAKLWRRTGVMTDAEFIELRYAGRPAAALRVVRAAYLAIIINCLVLGWVIFAMVTIVEMVLGLPPAIVMPILILVAVGYSTASGFWGVVATDALQFVVASVGSIALAYVAVQHAGGLDGMISKLQAQPGVLDLVPQRDSTMLPFEIFAIYLSVQWWATRNADGGEYMGQRLFAARSAADAQLGVLWYAICEYVVKLWPLIVVALASLVLYPDLTDHQTAYPLMIAEHLPIGLRGLLVASLLAAFMSTIDTHLSWGASYLVNDLYRRFWRKSESDAHYVKASRYAMVLMAVLAGLVSLSMTSVAETWKLLLALGSGQGLVVLLRWYWWRINAWSEFAAMFSSALLTGLTFWLLPGDAQYSTRLLIIVLGSTITWLAVTFLTAAEPLPLLRAFYARARPRGGYWGPVAPRAQRGIFGRDIIAWLLGVALVYAATFAVGELLIGSANLGYLLAAAAIVSGVVLLRLLRRDEEETDEPLSGASELAS